MGHLGKETLYFYLKDDITREEKGEITAHLASCPECLKACDSMRSLRLSLKKELIEPPALDLKPWAGAVTKPFYFKPAFAAAFAAVLLLSGIFIGGLALSEKNGEKVSDFVYKTYGTVYDFDYYKRHYMDNTNLMHEER